MQNDLFERATQNLSKYWGFPAFRPGQDDVVRSIFDGKETVVLFPTGGGKSLCYQVPATVLPGLTLVISPLVALMQDQVDQLNSRGIKATFINSTISRYEVEQRLINARNGMYTLLYCAPERLETPLFQQEAPDLNIQLVAVDEAHCISEWGHDFRPPYRKIRQNIEEVIGKTRWMALTATATPKVRDDIISVLNFKDPEIISKGFERKNLKWWVDVSEQKTTRMMKMITKATGSGLVYAGTRRACDELADLIRSKGFSCAAYHAGLSSDDRKRIQQQWIDNTLQVVVATNAFGMGIDKPDCRYVIHYDMSYSLEAYYQEAGRAGRDGAESYPTLLVKRGDLKMARKRVADTYPDIEILQHVYTSLCDSLHLAVGSQQEVEEAVSLDNISKRSGLQKRVIRASIRVLQRLGVIEMSMLQEPEFGVHFVLSKEVLIDKVNSYSNEAKKQFFENLMRLFIPEALNDEHFIDQKTVTSKLGLNVNAVIKGLEVFSKEGLLKWQLRVDDPIVRVFEPRMKKAPITRHDAEHFRNIQLGKLEKIIGYAETSGCRSMYIRRYFGEEEVPDYCGFCDRCLAKDKLKRSEFTDADVMMLIQAITESPATITELQEKFAMPAEKVEAILKWLSKERRVTYSRKKNLFSAR
ncbi:MAG: RecQ family ATP-dependent DNA helicase [Balneolales bacterium]|nr:RecQ family ATP-dependent DNA helicase [Balneolales bacterium]